jgi:hypothetical protein
MAAAAHPPRLALVMVDGRIPAGFPAWFKK